jgi:hypothetical protein
MVEYAEKLEAAQGSAFALGVCEVHPFDSPINR